jgi:predicted kinase
LGSDDLARTIAASAGLNNGDAYWLAYDVAFAMAEEWLSLGVSAVLDINLGWPFQWQHVDALRQRHPMAKIVPIVLRCSRQTCLERIDRRHAAEPSVFAPPSRFTTDPRILAVFDFVEAIDEAHATLVDAEGTADEVYTSVARLVADWPREAGVQRG